MKGISMNCPKCEEGILKKIQFKTDGRVAFLCDFCESLWFEDESITFSTGHSLGNLIEGNDLEYSYEILDEKDQDHQPAQLT